MAALSVAAATSWAQVYSVNAVGYVNMTIPANGSDLALLANPLNGTNNNLSTILPLTDDNFLTTVYLWDASPAVQNYVVCIWFGTGSGWQPDAAAPPGQAFFIQAVSSSGTLSITFVGEVPQGHLVNTLQAGPLLSLSSSIVPQQGTLDQLGFPGEFLDTVYLWDADGSLGSRQNYIPQINFGGPGTWSPDNSIKVGQGFFVQKAPGNTGLDWVRDFSVN
jgi:hypothetical protein